MNFFIDTASVGEIREAAELGLLDGVTTHPTLRSREPGDSRESLRQITGIVDAPVSADVTAMDHEEHEGMEAVGRLTGYSLSDVGPERFLPDREKDKDRS